MDLVTKAREFATQAHVGQKRKYSGQPYIVHPIAVAELVATVTEDQEVIAAALLHDTVEDTPVTIDEIEARFGPRVASLVSDLTDVSRKEDGNRAARRAIDRAHTALASPDAKTIKLCDLIDNTRTIVRDDPGFARIYMAEKRLMLEVLKEGHAGLHERASRIVADYYANNPPWN